MPEWLTAVSWVSVGLGFLTMSAVAVDVFRHPQHMKIMKVVWPVTAVYTPIIGWWLYKWMGRPLTGGMMIMTREHPTAHAAAPTNIRPTDWASVFRSATHCGGGCVIGDVIGAPIVMSAGWIILGERLFAEYAVEFALAYVLGIAFQYLPIRSLTGLSRGQALRDAVKSETLALIAFEVGLFGWMALTYFILFATRPPQASTIVFWFMMQIGMVLGLLTSYPANWWLVKAGIKAGM